MELKIKTPVARRVFTSSDNQNHENENDAKKAELILAGRKMILDSLPPGKFTLNPSEAAELVVRFHGDAFRELISRFKRIK